MKGGVSDLLRRAEFIRRETHSKNKKDAASSLSPYLRVLRKENVGGDTTTLGIFLFNCMRASDDDEALFLTLDDIAQLFTKENTIVYQVRDPETLKGASNLQLKGEMPLKTSSLNKPTKGVRVRSSSELSPFLKIVLELETQAVAKSVELQKTLKRHNSTSIFSESGGDSSFSFSDSESENEATENAATESVVTETEVAESVVIETVVSAERDVMPEEMMMVAECVAIQQYDQIAEAIEKCDILKTAAMEVNIIDVASEKALEMTAATAVGVADVSPKHTQTGIFLTKTPQPPEIGIFLTERSTTSQERDLTWLSQDAQKTTLFTPTPPPPPDKVKKPLNAVQKKRKAEMNKLYRAKKKKNAVANSISVKTPPTTCVDVKEV